MGAPTARTTVVGDVGRRAHVCALYSGPEERDRVLLPFLQEGLRQGDECVCLVDGMDPSRLRRRVIGPAGVGRLDGHLRAHPVSDVCARPGELSVEQVTTLLATTLASSSTDGVPVVRAAAEMSWRQRPAAQDVLDYESAVGEVLAALPAVFLCLHDLAGLGNGMLVDVLQVHSTVLLEGTVLHHLHRPAPEDRPRPPLVAGARYPLATLPGSGREGGREGGGRWLSLTGAELRVAELVASGMTNRAMAAELHVSPHTVDAHLKHMYVKLGIHSRVELTVLALRTSGSAS